MKGNRFQETPDYSCWSDVHSIIHWVAAMVYGMCCAVLELIRKAHLSIRISREPSIFDTARLYEIGFEQRSISTTVEHLSVE